MAASLAIFFGILIFVLLAAHKMDKDDERKRRRRERLYTDRLSKGGKL